MRKKGISLIVLIITIIVIIILAGSVILSLTKNNPISTAKEAVFKSDLATIRDEINLYSLNKLTESNGNFDTDTLNGKVSDFVQGLTKYDNELSIVNGKLTYIGSDSTKARIVSEMIDGQEIVYNGDLTYNKPDLSYLPEATTKAVKWDGNNVESELTLTQAKTDTSWYDYSSKKWANIYTNNNNNKAYWVWIPRYAYKITNSHSSSASQIDIKFLSGTSNVAVDGSSTTGYTVHPAFTFGGKQLSGIWVAKYEASSSQPTKTQSSEPYLGASLGGGNVTDLEVRVLPSVYSWRYISEGNIQTVSMNMTSSQGSVGVNENIDTHQMKNVEWGAIAYLSQSKYGQEPWINPYGDTMYNSWKMKTGYAGTSKNSHILSDGNSELSAYNTSNGVNASTTGNIYGVYDISGGAWEKTASLINNGNGNISAYGKSEHIDNNKIKSEYVKYYDIYDPGNDEKEGGVFYGSDGGKIWYSVPPYDSTQDDNNIIRKRLTDETYANFANKKGDALWETSSNNSYFGRFTSGNMSYQWIMGTTVDSDVGEQYATGWNDDVMAVGHVYRMWFYRGGCFSDGSRAGLFASSSVDGDPDPYGSFRPVLVQGESL